MRSIYADQTSYFPGIIASLIGHVLLAFGAIFVLQHGAANASQQPEVFTVTLEGGENLGGAFQLPKDGKQPKKAPPETPSTETQPPAQPEKADKETKSTAKEKAPEAEEKVEKKLTEPSVVDDPQKQLEAKRLQEKKELEEKKKQQQEQDKKKAEEAKKKAAEEAKKEQERKKIEDAKRQEQERKARNARLAAVARRIKNTYEGESADVGGTGFGAARLGGEGFGGGTLASAEKIAYQNALQQHVKSGWRWMPSTKRLRALVVVQILQNGKIQDARIQESSGNSNFDDSILRAIRKADPVPPPPEKYYADFRIVRFWFDSADL